MKFRVGIYVNINDRIKTILEETKENSRYPDISWLSAAMWKFSPRGQDVTSSAAGDSHGRHFQGFLSI